ncbi:unnamed protein product [Effrenium voratum]|nr:unnamed protein product [Effrenium voratum]
MSAAQAVKSQALLELAISRDKRLWALWQTVSWNARKEEVGVDLFACSLLRDRVSCVKLSISQLPIKGFGTFSHGSKWKVINRPFGIKMVQQGCGFKCASFWHKASVASLLAQLDDVSPPIPP